MGTLLQDLRYGIRMLARSLGFTAVAVVTLALGIGANTAVFSVLNAVLLRPLPYLQSDRLVSLQSLDSRTHTPANLSYPDFFDFRSLNHVFEHLVTYRDDQFTLTGFGEPTHLDGEIVTWDLFPLLGVQPALGRGFLPSEEAAGTRVVVLSYELWERQFGGDRTIVGRTITLDRQPHTVVGVAPKGFLFPVDNPAISLWTTVAREGNTVQRGARQLPSLARLKPGVTIDQARAQMDLIAAALARQYPDSNTNVAAIHIQPELERLVGKTRRPLLVLLGAVGLVLLIACANIAGLLLARMAAREHEMAVRAALGASRARVIRQLLTESLLLALLGSAGGTWLAQGALSVVLPLGGSIPGLAQRLAQASIDGRVLAFSIVLAILTSVLFGTVPALHASCVDLTGSLKEGARSNVRAHDRWRSSLVVAQIGLGLVLVTGAGLLIASFLHLEQSDLGMRTDHLLTFWFSLPEEQYNKTQQVNFYDRLLERLNSLPGVQSAAGVWPLPLGGDRARVSFNIKERPAPPPKRPHCDMAFVTPGYFKTTGVPLLKGRVFTERDNAKAPPVLVVNQTFADRYFPGEDVIGKRIQPGTGSGETREIVGVVGDVKLSAWDREPMPVYYFPYKQLPWQPPIVTLRTAVPPRALESAVRKEMAALDPQVPVYQVRTMDDLFSLQITPPRFLTMFLISFAGIALVLAMVGLYGVMAYSVARRTREIGVRMALGASRRTVLTMVLKQALALVVAGTLLGLAGALAAGQLLRSMLYGVTPMNPAVLALACMLVALTSTLAAYLPARRATKVDPMVALRYE